MVLLNRPKAENLEGNSPIEGDTDTIQNILSELLEHEESNYIALNQTINTKVSELNNSLAQQKEYTDSELAKKQPNLTFDETPTDESSNPCTSGGIKEYVDTQTTKPVVKQDFSGQVAAITPTTNTIYEYANVGGLTLTDIPVTHQEILFYFNTTQGFTIGLPQGTPYVTSLICGSGGRYVLSILNGIVVVSPISFVK